MSDTPSPTPEERLEGCEVPIGQKKNGYHPIPQSTRDMYDYGHGHTLPATPATKTHWI